MLAPTWQRAALCIGADHRVTPSTKDGYPFEFTPITEDNDNSIKSAVWFDCLHGSGQVHKWALVPAG